MSNKKIIFTNGCFDILHKGHIELFKYCKSLGKVIVGLNSDSSAKRIKGELRPINSQEDRKLLLDSCKFIDEVIIFEEDTPINLIAKVKPDIIVKGGDYLIGDVVGSDKHEVKIFVFITGYSSTTIIRSANLTNSQKKNLESLENSQIVVKKGWGHERWITNTEKYCGKLLFFYKEKKCSWHYHNIKDEVFYIQSGRIELVYGYEDDKSKGKAIILEKGDSFHVPAGLRHQMFAQEETELFEFSTQHFEEDSIRLEKGD